MNYKLPIVSAVVGLLFLVAVAASKSSQRSGTEEVANSQVRSPRQPPAANPPESRPNGQELVAQAVQRLLVTPGLEAKTRQSVYLFGQKLIGSGSYCQLANGPKLYLKLDLKLRVAEQVRNLRQISDGDSLWEVQGRGDEQTYAYVNLGRLRKVASETQPTVPPTYWMALGGIPRLLAKLDECFTFGTAEPMRVGDLPVWRVEGTWKRSLLANMFPEHKQALLAGDADALAELPEQMPHGVTLVLGRDSVIPLFPYSFAFYRQRPDDRHHGQVSRVPLVTWELFEVHIRPDLRPSDFDFHPPDQEFQERTDQYVARLKAAADKLARPRQVSAAGRESQSR